MGFNAVSLPRSLILECLDGPLRPIAATVRPVAESLLADHPTCAGSAQVADGRVAEVLLSSPPEPRLLETLYHLAGDVPLRITVVPRSAPELEVIFQRARDRWDEVRAEELDVCGAWPDPRRGIVIVGVESVVSGDAQAVADRVLGEGARVERLDVVSGAGLKYLRTPPVRIPTSSLRERIRVRRHPPARAAASGLDAVARLMADARATARRARHRVVRVPTPRRPRQRLGAAGPQQGRTSGPPPSSSARVHRVARPGRRPCAPCPRFPPSTSPPRCWAGPMPSSPGQPGAAHGRRS